MNVGSDQIQSIILARRLVLLTHQVEKQRQNPNAEVKSFKEIMDEDEIQLSGGLEKKKNAPSASERSTHAQETQPRMFPDGTTFETLA
ncbi:MAG: DUF1676 domain-containing protein [Leptolinea sp.]|nr:DUF1676 domain-containing protein [Leptolinea sp.]